ncbi:ATP-dependent helicase C-terminal domain-containing protein [Jidongwangia harbinensis]|uniref:ATP-dependent helicase C-terminal domain-containing protein n=1 Tax=Jidongwangia harbinensis TaxID=2878561 RepID=UPI001CD97A66|nr:ATP-dependent helicase C-terminal domain-containing protein [Jidongwangia harbinensis]MCA2214794.1 ATP-dependent helicase HrpB [Jidongwangia harbinensis]
MAADALPDLPVREVLPAVVGALADAGVAVLVAPPGTGKTTLVPPALAGGPRARVVVAEPRRVAARAAARRMADLVGEPVGGRIGYAVRGDRRVSRDTEVEVVTTGVLVRRLQRDPELAGTAVVILDECHERHLDSDLALAFLIEVRAALRPDLRVLATSATAESERLADLLGGTEPAPVVTAFARTYPVEVVWSPPPAPVAPPHGLRVDPRLLDHVAATVRRALADGDVLAFLPGAGEIAAVAGRLHGVDADVVSLHGRQSGSVQDAALRPGPRRRVVLATAVAESSLTVPGVRAVVDAGLSRVPRMDHTRGLGALVTVPVSRAAAEQRAGRAGREAPGRAYRCWSAAQHERLPARPEPEIAAADLTGFVLDLALWGHPDGRGLSLPDAPPAGALQTALGTLRDLGAVDSGGRVTARGRALADVGLHPRLARALLDGADAVGARRAAEVVALLDDTRAAGDDLVAVWRRARNDRDGAWRAEVRRLTEALNRGGADRGGADRGGADRGGADRGGADRGGADRGGADRGGADRGGADRGGADRGGADRGGADRGGADRGGADRGGADRGGADRGGADRGGADRGGADRGEGSGDRGGWSDDLAAGLVVGLAYPERVARVRDPGGSAYLMVGGTAAELAPGSGLAGTPWLAVADADRAAGARTARIRSAAPLDEATALQAAATLRTAGSEIGWVDGDVVARSVRRLGSIVLAERRLDDPDPASVRAALLDGLRRDGLSLLSWSRAATEVRERMAFARAALGEPWPAVDDDALLDAAGDWLPLDRARRRADLARIDVVSALRRLLPWSVAGRLDEVAPERLPVPSGSRVRVDYADPAAPVLAVKVQEAFGWRAAPRLADGRVPVLLHLLSPAGRPVAVTRDLASFWAVGYPQVRAELRGRYPKHPWPEDPTTAEPTRRTNRRAR